MATASAAATWPKASPTLPTDRRTDLTNDMVQPCPIPRLIPFRIDAIFRERQATCAPRNLRRVDRAAATISRSAYSAWLKVLALHIVPGRQRIVINLCLFSPRSCIPVANDGRHCCSTERILSVLLLLLNAVTCASLTDRESHSSLSVSTNFINIY